MFDSNRYYAVSEVAQILAVNRKTVWAMAKDGRLPPTHAALHKFRGDQLARWAEAGRPWRELIADVPSNGAEDSLGDRAAESGKL